jgi:translation initiation factor 2 beta subunit (eIF-2beta)/eIF-5
MPIELSQVGWMELYSELRRPRAFLSSFFKIRPGNVSSSEKVQLDIERFGEQVAVAIKGFTGSNLNDFSDFTSKEFIPPRYGEAFPINANDLLKRMAGTDPYSAAKMSASSKLTALMAKGFVLVDDKITRAVEMQASQILQTGNLTLIDKNGDTAYELDYKPKTSHFPTVATSWSAAGADPMGDLESLAETIRADGKIDPNLLILGSTARRNFLKNEDVLNALDNRRVNVGEVSPELTNSGATFHGFIWIGNYEFQLWSYPETYDHIQTGATTKYVEADKVIMLSDKTRLDRKSAEVPLLVSPDPRVAGLVPGRMSSAEGGFDVTPNVYVTPDGKQVMGELESRTLLIPTQIDGFGCLDTEI